MSGATASHHGRKHLKVFLSHSYADTVLARKIRNLLHERLGLKMDLHEDLSFGETWLSKLRKEIEACDTFVPLITPESTSDNWLLQETGAAWGLGKPIVPIVTRRDTLSQFPIAIERHVTLQPSELDDSVTAERFIREFEDALAASHAR
ncbi:MAG TPA: toll/interleukin-1 receptor domain-containing protein [Bryobacteraceae bacterium]|nr:toll/interleukin-1 receptor domain-containing protein [Bryobacteraceae bacterium]